MHDTYQPNYSEDIGWVARSLGRIADDMDESATLRDRFAMAALPALVSRGMRENGVSELSAEATAKDAYLIADAMLRIRLTGQGDG